MRYDNLELSSRGRKQYILNERGENNEKTDFRTNVGDGVNI